MRNTWKAVFVTIILAFSLCAPAMAGPSEDAEAAWMRGDYATAERLYRSLAEQGKASAQHFLAKMYENGQAVSRNSAEAAKWYRRAAEQGHSGAQFYLAGMYSAGEGVPRDYVEAYIWFSLSAAGSQGEFAESGRASVAEKMTSAQVAEAERRVREWKAKNSR